MNDDDDVHKLDYAKPQPKRWPVLVRLLCLLAFAAALWVAFSLTGYLLITR